MKTKTLNFPESCAGIITEAGTLNLRQLIASYDVVRADLSKTVVISSAWLNWLARHADAAEQVGHKLIVVNARGSIKSMAGAVGITLKFE